MTSSHSQIRSASPPPRASCSASRCPSQYVRRSPWPRQDRLGRRARVVTPSFAQTTSDGLLGHQPVRRELAADDRDEVARSRRACRGRSRRAPARSRARRPRRRTRPVPRACRAAGRPRRRAAGASAAGPGRASSPSTMRSSTSSRPIAVHVRVVDRHLGRAEDRDRVDRDHDVAVVGRVAAVDDGIGHPLVEDEHRALAGRHRELRRRPCPRRSRPTRRRPTRPRAARSATRCRSARRRCRRSRSRRRRAPSRRRGGTARTSEPWARAHRRRWPRSAATAPATRPGPGRRAGSLG